MTPYIYRPKVDTSNKYIRIATKLALPMAT